MERLAQAPRKLPPGFRFHPTDEELVVQYLGRKALSRPLPAAVIPVVHDVARLDPWDLPGASEGEGYFFSLRRGPATGRSGCRRRAGSGYWKATGKAKPVLHSSGCGGKQHLVGVKTALTFHRGEPSSSRTRWVMHEYRLAVPVPGGVAEQRKNASHGCVVQPGEWVVCRIFLKNRPRRPNRVTVGNQTPGNRPSVAHRTAPQLQHQQDAGQLRPWLLTPPSSSSSSSCVTGVTDISDQEEVSSSSSSSSRDAPAASQRVR
ncbi:NAC domain-containing protein 83-like [Phragmites australis]|uniref:NAC domain-containing protein 83-like n=1 Tax=Phragmites australis TaxID=29695 RepID=UPI002D788C0F|nr:NAC domain-containing protein 83-like [Phragmites australis]